MIGLHLHWGGASLTPPAAQRFAASLAVGTARKPVSLAVDGAHFATACALLHRPHRLASGEILLFAGHIDNRADLRRDLGRGGTDDPALYAAAYAAWGDAADLRVLGDFCTILCDPAHRRVRIGRAPLGGPPLHYYRDADRLIVASTPRAIFATGTVEQAIDEQKVADSLMLNYCEEERGWFRDIARLPGGTRLIFTPQRIVRDTYYDPFDRTPVRLGSDDAYVEAADALFEEGTRAALDGFSQPAVSISGGLDSQAVAAYALRLRPEGRLLGLTSIPESGWDGLVPDNRFGDESEHVRAFAAMHPRFDMQMVDAQGLSFDHHLQNLYLLAGIAPRNVANLHWIHELYKAARTQGRDVLLVGNLGNMSFSFNGTGRLPSLLRGGRWGEWLRELRAIDDGRSLPRKLVGGALPLAPEWLQNSIARLRGQDANPSFFFSAINPDYAAEMRVAERAADMGFDPTYPPATDTMQARQAMLGNAWNESGDFMQAMELLHGIPTRDPTAYRPLVEFCLSIPDDQYLRAGQSRWLARRMLRGMIPDQVLAERRKGLQSADWHLRLGRQRAALREELDRLSEDSAMTHRFDLASLKAALDDWPAKTPDNGEQKQRLLLALPRTIATARFIRFVEGSNAP